MDTNADETLRLADETVSLYRSVKLRGAHEVVTGDRMIVQLRKEDINEDFVVVKVSEELKVKRVSQQISIPMPSSSTLDDGTITLTEVVDGSEKRLLAIYKKFPTTTSR
jgi:hypothetical protein